MRKVILLLMILAAVFLCINGVVSATSINQWNHKDRMVNKPITDLTSIAKLGKSAKNTNQDFTSSFRWHIASTGPHIQDNQTKIFNGRTPGHGKTKHATEPATMLLLGFGLIGLATISRKFKKD